MKTGNPLVDARLAMASPRTRQLLLALTHAAVLARDTGRTDVAETAVSLLQEVYRSIDQAGGLGPNRLKQTY